MKSAKQFQFHAIIIKVFCFDLPSPTLTTRFFRHTFLMSKMYKLHCFVNFARKKLLSAIYSKQMMASHRETELCFEIDSLREASRFSAKFCNFPRNSETNCKPFYFTIVLLLLSIFIFSIFNAQISIVFR